MSLAIRRLLFPSNATATASLYRNHLRVVRPRLPFSSRICHQTCTFSLSMRLRGGKDEAKDPGSQEGQTSTSRDANVIDESAQEKIQVPGGAATQVPESSRKDVTTTPLQRTIKVADHTGVDSSKIEGQSSQKQQIVTSAHGPLKQASPHDSSIPTLETSTTKNSTSPTNAADSFAVHGGRTSIVSGKKTHDGLLDEIGAMIEEQAELLGMTSGAGWEMKGSEELKSSLAKFTPVEQRQVAAEWQVLKQKLEGMSPDDRQEYIDSMVPMSSEVPGDPLQVRTRPKMPPPDENEDDPASFSNEQLEFLGLTKEDIRAMQGLGGTVDYARAARIGIAMSRAGFTSDEITEMLELDPEEQLEYLKYGPGNEDDGAIIEDEDKDTSVLEWQKRIGISDRKIAYYLDAFGDNERFQNDQEGILDLPLMEAMHKEQIQEHRVAELLEELGGFLTVDMALAIDKGEVDLATLKPLMERYTPELALTIARKQVPEDEVAKMTDRYPGADPSFIMAYFMNQIPRSKADALIERLGEYATHLRLFKGLVSGKYTELSVLNWRDKYPGITGDTVAGLVTRDLDRSVVVPLLEKYGPAVVTSTMMAAFDSEIVDEARIAELVNKYPGIWDALIIMRVQKAITAKEIRQVIATKKSVDQRLETVNLGPPVLNIPRGEAFHAPEPGKLGVELQKMMVARGSELLPKEPVLPESEDPVQHIVAALPSAISESDTPNDEMEIARKALAGDGKAIEEMLDLMKKRQELTSSNVASEDPRAEKRERDTDSMTDAELEKFLDPDRPPWEEIEDVEPDTGRLELQKVGLDAEMDKLSKETRVPRDTSTEAEDQTASFIRDNKPLVDELTSGKYTDESLLEAVEHLQEKYEEFLRSGKAGKGSHAEEMAHMEKVMNRSKKGPMDLKDIVALISHPSTLSIYKQMQDMGLRIDSSQEEIMAAIQAKFAAEEGVNKYWRDENGHEVNVFYPRNMEELKKARKAYEAGATTEYMKQTGINLSDRMIISPPNKVSTMVDPVDIPIKGDLPEPGENEFFADYIGRTTPNMEEQEMEEEEKEDAEEQEDIFNYVESPDDPDKEAGGDEQFDSDDLTTMGHGELEQHRELREYARLAAWELPLLNKLKKPFHPPSKNTPLRFRYTTYMGESHPASKKVVLEFDPSDLPGLTKPQINKLIKLVGPRYQPVSRCVRMSCESFETQAQNKRYLGDLVAKLVNEARDGQDMFEDLPIDMRHVKKKKDYWFPEEWKLDTIEKRERLDEKKAETAERLNDYKVADRSLMNGRESVPKIADGVRIVEGALDKMAARQPVERAPTVLGSRTGTAPNRAKRRGPLPSF